MSKFKYFDGEKAINAVLHYQNQELSEIDFSTLQPDKYNIEKSEQLLMNLGYQLPGNAETSNNKKKIITVPAWDELCDQAISEYGINCDLDSLFTEDELKSNEIAISKLNNEYKMLYHLDKYDIAISVLAGITSAIVDILLVGIPHKTANGLKAAPLSDYVRDYFEKKFPKEEMEKLANSSISKVPFDAQDNRHTKIHVEGLSSYYHRLLQLGHDPLLGFVFGVTDILTGRMTTIDKSGKVVSQIMVNYADRKESDIFAALMKQVAHFKSDITTSMGLPAPLMSLFNFLQFGNIGEEEQTIAEIVQGMYYEGYDFVHFCSMSIPTMLVEVMTRLGYAIKRKKEGYSLKESIPFSKSRDKHPNLATMLFIGHSVATAVNAGKIYFTHNPVAINYPQWLTFAKYSYKQLKWVILEKPELRDAYVLDKIDKELQDLIIEIEQHFEEIIKGNIVVFE